MIVPVILSGGSGSRLWPLSRELYPKQFLPLVDTHSLFQITVLRVQAITDITPPIVICNHEHRFMVAEQLRTLNVTTTAVILEPVGRNTAPAVTVAALQAMAAGDDPILLVLPADHMIADADCFRRAVEHATPLAESGRLITFGIVPTAPETGYGYIEAGAPLAGGDSYAVECFVEKPDATTAQAYLEAGDYYWNSGMFMFRASVFLEELAGWAPAIANACRLAHAGGQADLDFLRLDRAAFEACPSDSIDYAIMEKTRNAVVIPLDVGWNDVGAWSALWQIGEHDANGNRLSGDVLTVDTHNSYVRAESRLVATVGISDLIVVETADAVLVAQRDRVQEVKTVVNRLNAARREEARNHRKVYRPWGAYDCLDNAERFQVKHITVNPGASLSLQMHHHRAEHWTVVRGTAKVTCGDKISLLTENQSTYIPVGTPHRLENPGKIPLELIEVQSGSYLGEDDIIRFEDNYGRQQDS
ncbi:MAG: mannose-1-phosphate guanylyltransferase/mannose-6-phosphate isomerase [Candidatus Competibacteraceae bacterium]